MVLVFMMQGADVGMDGGVVLHRQSTRGWVSVSQAFVNHPEVRTGESRSQKGRN